ncbi:MAG: hypothetical protein AB1349_14530 [Elusimicrobiota bacterium]
MKKASQILLILTFTLILMKCGKDEPGDSDASNFFVIDKSKLAAEITDQNLGISFQPPNGWAFQSAELSKKIESRNKLNTGEAKNFQYQPVYLFFSDSTFSLLSIGEVNYPDTNINVQMKINLYKNLLSNKLKKDKLAIGTFKKSNTTFFQFRSEKESFINYKIIFQNLAGQIVQFDCTLTKQNAEGELHKLKSFLGSVSLIKFLNN